MVNMSQELFYNRALCLPFQNLLEKDLLFDPCLFNASVGFACWQSNINKAARVFTVDWTPLENLTWYGVRDSSPYVGFGERFFFSHIFLKHSLQGVRRHEPDCSPICPTVGAPCGAWVPLYWALMCWGDFPYITQAVPEDSIVALCWSVCFIGASKLFAHRRGP